VARARHETSVLGSVLDIAADRAVEIVLWVGFADLDLIPLSIPIIVIIRGTVVDALRGGSTGKGKTPFGLTSSKWGRRIVGSSLMRSSYGAAKGVAFCSLAIVRALQLYHSGTPGGNLLPPFHLLANIMSWIAIALCIVRAIPVLVEVPASMQEPDE
jgi:CDP-diacylglycerol--glycerol-3-phosphate 3-phosphatidyltransferase